MRWLLGLLAFAACGDDPHLGPIDAPEADAPEIDAPPIDALEIDAQVIDGPPIDVPDWVGDGPQPQFCVTNGDCLPGQFCPFADRSYCRHRFQPASCMPRPSSCPAPNPGDRPVCGCDGWAYATDCDAHVGGTTVGPGGCDDQGPLYACGDTFCERGSEYCAELRYNDDFPSRAWECRPVPAAPNPCNELMNMNCPGMGMPVPGGIAESCTFGEPGEVFYMCYVRWT